MSSSPPWNRLEAIAGAAGLVLLVLAAALLAWHQWVFGFPLLAVSLIAAGNALFASRAQATQSGFEADHTKHHHVVQRRQQIELSDAQLALAMLSRPADYVQIVTEYVEPRTRAVYIDTHYLVDTLAPMRSGFIAPMIMSKKGELHDRMMVKVNGVEVAYSTFEESVNYIMNSMYSFVAGMDRIHSADFDMLTDGIWREITRVKSGDRLEWRKQCQLLCNAVKKSPLNEDVASVIEAIVDILSEYYVICVPVPEEVKIRVQSTELRIMHQSRHAALASNRKSRFVKLLKCVRTFFGVRTATIAVDISKAYRCREYHLEIMGPVGTYLAHVVSSHRRGLFRGYIRLRSRAGQRYLHFFAKDLRAPALDNRGLKTDFDPVFGGVYFERPPGSLLSATASTFAGAFIIGMVGHLGLATSGSGLSALLLAAPGAVVGWTGFGDAKLVGVTVCSRVYATGTLLLTMLSLGLLVLESAQPHGSLHKWYPYGWKFLMVAAAALAAASLYSLIKRQVRHSLTLREGGISA